VSSFVVDCPHCKKRIDFLGDDWDDRLVDDSTDHEFQWPSCGKEYLLEVKATYEHTAKLPEEE